MVSIQLTLCLFCEKLSKLQKQQKKKKQNNFNIDSFDFIYGLNNKILTKLAQVYEIFIFIKKWFVKCI